MGSESEELAMCVFGSTILIDRFNRLQEKFGRLLIVGMSETKVTFHLGRSVESQMYTLYDNGCIFEMPGQNETTVSTWLSKLADGRYVRKEDGSLVMRDAETWTARRDVTSREELDRKYGESQGHISGADMGDPRHPRNWNMHTQPETDFREQS